MADMNTHATLILFADEAMTRLRDYQKQAAEKQAAVTVSAEQTAQVADALQKQAHIRPEHQETVAQALLNHGTALEMLEKLAQRTAPVAQQMGQEVKPTEVVSPLRRHSHDDTEAGRRFRAAFAR